MDGGRIEPEVGLPINGTQQTGIRYQPYTGMFWNAPPFSAFPHDLPSVGHQPPTNNLGLTGMNEHFIPTPILRVTSHTTFYQAPHYPLPAPLTPPGSISPSIPGPYHHPQVPQHFPTAPYNAATNNYHSAHLFLGNPFGYPSPPQDQGGWQNAPVAPPNTYQSHGYPNADPIIQGNLPFQNAILPSNLPPTPVETAFPPSFEPVDDALGLLPFNLPLPDNIGEALPPVFQSPDQALTFDPAAPQANPAESPALPASVSPEVDGQVGDSVSPTAVVPPLAPAITPPLSGGEEADENFLPRLYGLQCRLKKNGQPHVACYHCKRRKIKCDGKVYDKDGRPWCIACITRRGPCYWPEPYHPFLLDMRGEILAAKQRMPRGPDSDAAEQESFDPNKCFKRTSWSFRYNAETGHNEFDDKPPQKGGIRQRQSTPRHWWDKWSVPDIVDNSESSE